MPQPEIPIPRTKPAFQAASPPATVAGGPLSTGPGVGAASAHNPGSRHNNRDGAKEMGDGNEHEVEKTGRTGDDCRQPGATDAGGNPWWRRRKWW